MAESEEIVVRRSAGVLSAEPLSERGNGQWPRGHEVDGRGEELTYMGLLQRGLRGRIGIAVALAIAGLAGGAWLGWTHGRVVYRSEGLVRIAYARPAIMTDTDLNEPMAMYEQFMQSQVLLLSSQRVVARALREPPWVATGRGDSAQMAEEFARKLKLDHPFNTQNLRVAYESSDPAESGAAVRSMVAAYKEVYSGHEEQFQEQRLVELGKHEEALVAELKELETKLGATNSDELAQEQQAAKAEDAALTTRVVELRLADALSGPGKPEEAVGELTVNEIAMIDPSARSLQATVTQCQDQVVNLQLRGVGEKHQVMILARSELERATQRLNQYVEEFRKARVAEARQGGHVQGLSQQEIAKQLAIVTGLQDKTREDLRRLGVQRRDAEQLEAQLALKRQDLTQTRERRGRLMVESAGSGRLEIVSAGEVPLRPAADTRIKYSGAGALAGMVLPVGLLTAIGLARRKYCYVEEISSDIADAGRTPLLGILPALRNWGGDEERAADAAQCVHQIRVQLAHNKRQGKNAFLITSPAPGEGKTSLVASLGYSFRASGMRTLLIDCDVIGQHLSRGFGAGGKAGICDVIATGKMQRCMLQIEPGLNLMPVGAAQASDACIFSEHVVKGLLDKARRYYDVVLVDSGPLPGSVEALVLAPLVDKVVMITARGESSRLIERTLFQLHSVGANVAGFVFNRAGWRDFARSSQCVWSRSVNSTALAAPAVRSSSGFGPLVDAVLQYMPAKSVLSSQYGAKAVTSS